MPRKEQRGGLGRRLAIGIYSIALAYLVIVGFASVIPQVFWPASDDYDMMCASALAESTRPEIDPESVVRRFESVLERARRACGD